MVLAIRFTGGSFKIEVLSNRLTGLNWTLINTERKLATACLSLHTVKTKVQMSEGLDDNTSTSLLSADQV